MTTRRKFLSQLGITATSPAILFSQGKEKQKEHSRWEMIFNSDDTKPALCKPTPKLWSDSTITAAWIGHATVLINFFGTTIITDPVFAECVGINLFGFLKIGPKRLVAPAMTIDELPKIDLILLSHAHFDHLDISSLKKFDENIPVVMAKNTADVLQNLDFKKVKELDWGEKFFVAGLEIEAHRVKHFGWRYPWETDRSRGNMEGRSFSAYLISKNGKHIFFGGDTAYQEYFKPIGERNIEIELAIMPIGAYNPWISVHANPEQAVQMAQHLNAKNILPIHWHTYTLSSEPIAEPLERLKDASLQSNISIALETIGQEWKWKENGA